jgi:thiol-disulfide isomerase/thioredoxin
MKTFKIITLLLLISFSNYCKSFKTEIPVYNYKEFKHLLNLETDKIVGINFWATWCAPCVKELPYFIELEKKNKKIDLYLISLDINFKTLKRYVDKHQIKSKVILLDDPDQNKWIPQVNKKWSGSIPATLFYNNAKRIFIEKEVKYQDLESIIKEFK